MILVKDPDAHLDYGVDWSEWLDGDTIVSSTWDVPAGITGSAPSFSTTATIIWLDGGTIGIHYVLTNHITTTEGREDDRRITILVQER